jgi:hypothetical protein
MADNKIFGMSGLRQGGASTTRGSLLSGGAELSPMLARLVSTPPALSTPTGVGQGYVPSQGATGFAAAPVVGMEQAPTFGGGFGMAPQNFNAPVLAFRSQGFADGGMVDPNMMQMPGPQGMPDPAANLPSAPPLGPQQLQAETQRVANANPQVIQQLQQVIMQALQSGQLTEQDLNMAVQLARAAAQNPQLYPRLRQLAIQDLPPEYDQGIVFALLLAGEAVQRMMGNQQVPQPEAQGAAMADGGVVTPGAYAAGGGVAMGSPTGDKTGRADDIPIRVSGGEYVIPAHVVQAKGTEFFDRMLAQYNGSPDKSEK